MQKSTIIDLLKAVMGEDTATALTCLRNGVDPNGFEDSDMIRPLHFVALKKSQEIAEILILYGADPFLENADGETANDIAIEFNFLPLINLFRFSNKIGKLLN